MSDQPNGGNRFGPFCDAPELDAAKQAIEGLPVGIRGEVLPLAYTESIAAAALRAALPIVEGRIRADLIDAAQNVRPDVTREWLTHWLVSNNPVGAAIPRVEGGRQ
jgi:hypothetical protein